MKLIIFHPTLPAYRRDFFKALDQKLKKEGTELTIIHGTSFFNKPINPDASPAYSTIPLKTKESNFFGFHIIRWKGVFKEIKRIKPDMVIILFCPGNVTLWLVQLYCYMRRIKVGLWGNGSGRREIKGLKKNLRGAFHKFFLRRADFHVCYGSKFQKELFEMGIDRSKVFVAQNTINVEKILSASPDVNRNLNNEYFNFLYVGAIERKKNLDLTIKAIARLIREGHKIKFSIVGQPALDELKALVIEEKMEENIFVLGFKPESEIPSYFTEADIFLLPVMGGLSINEAMAYGLPLISTIADGTIVDLLYDGENGYFLNEEPDVENLYETCKKAILGGKEKLEEMGTRSRQIIGEKALLSNMVSGFEKAINYGKEKLTKS